MKNFKRIITIFYFIILFFTGSAFSQPSIRTYALKYFEEPKLLLSEWSNAVVPVSDYTLQEIEAQRWLNDKEDFILTHDPIPDSLETFPDNLSLPIEKRNIDFEEITPYTWKWIYFELPKPDGSISEIALRRPNWWILHNKADSIGNKVFLSIIEAGIFGKAVVTGINPNQLDTRFYENEWKDKKTYRPITGWFKHNNDETWNYYFEGEPEPIGATPNHPFWSINRKAYIPVGELKIGEKARTETGTVSKLLKKEKREGREPVYNLEIYRDHNFHVGEQGLLVHNSCADDIKLQNAFLLDLNKKSFHSKIRAKLPTEISNTEGLVLLHYTINGYKKINPVLRGKAGHDMTEAFKLYADYLNKTLDKLPKYQVTEVFRGVNSKTMKPSNFIENQEWSDAGFLSTSTKESTARRFAKKIHKYDPAGTIRTKFLFKITHENGRSIKDFSRFDYEGEILFKSGTKFKVTYKKEIDGIWHIHLTEK